MFILIEKSGVPVGYAYDEAGTLTQEQAQAAMTGNLDNARLIRRVEMSAEMADLLAAGHLCSNGITMDASFAAMQLLRSGHELATATNATTMDITDFNNVEHVGIALDDVWIMLISLGGNYQQLRARKLAARAAVDAAATVADVRAVTL